MEEYVMQNPELNSEIKNIKEKLRKINNTLVVICILCVVMALVSLFDIFGNYLSAISEIPISPNRTLVVEISSSTSKDISDKTQVKNALQEGGMIVLKSSDYESSLGTEYQRYGANDDDGYFFTLGGVLNYISSKGWELLQTPSSGLSDYYYFVR